MSDRDEKIIAEFRANAGRVGGHFEGAPMILIHHVGAKSGTERITPLVHFPEDDDNTVIVASNNGGHTHPAWFHNLKANPTIDVEVGVDTYRVVAEELPRPERDRFWERVVAERPGFRAYAENTDRLIPLLRLTRVA